MAAAAEVRGPRSLDPLIWKACAGSSVRVPAMDSLVYYFPQGHAEQAVGGVEIASVPCVRPYSVCRIAGVQLLANGETDEVYARMRLDPRVESARETEPACFSAEDPGRGRVASFAKVLTPSDANNGGGFSVPRCCADSIFPSLDYGKDPPVQMLTIRDVHGAAWQFRHIYRGTPRRHLLTTGWSRFVNCKKLVAGDSVVFVKNGSDDLFIGVRRTSRSAGPSGFPQCSSKIGPPGAPSAMKPGELPVGREGFSRNSRGKDTPEAVVEAVKLAGKDQPFEVVYYPRVGSSGFVVRKDVVEASLHVLWSAGARVKMAVETDDSSRTTWYQGTVSCIIRHLDPFTFSPWRTLEVTWDEPDVLKNVKMVNPWEVEPVSTPPQIPPPYPSIKKPRIMQNQGLLTDGAEQNIFFPASGFSDTMMGDINSPMYSRDIFPAGMQGARHDLICVSSLFNFLPNGARQMFTGKIDCNKIPPKANPVHSELDIGSESPLESSSPPSISSIHRCGPELFSNSTGNAPSKVINVSFQLFGKTIHMELPAVTDVKEESKDNRIADRSFDISLFKPREELHHRHDGPPQRDPPAGT